METKRIWTQIVLPVVLAIGLIIAIIWGTAESSRANTYQTNLENVYRRAFIELMNNFSEMESTLAKLMIVNSPGQCVLLLDDIWRISGTSVGLMSQIPSSHVDTAGMNQFLVRVGDYARSLTNSVIKGAPISTDDEEQLRQLHAKSLEITEYLYNRVQNGDIPLNPITDEDYFTSTYGAEGNDDEGIDSEKSTSEFPTLIYDGPFSEAAENSEPKGVTGEEIDADAALKAAQEFCGSSDLVLSSESNGKIPSFDFSGTASDGQNVEISVTKQGGHILWMMSSASGNEEGKPSQEDVDAYEAAAEEFLKEKGYKGMQATYAQYYNGSVLINFAWTINDVVVYNDLVKVWVDREDESIIGFDARNYLSMHTERELETPQISMEEAESMLKDGIEVETRRMALIPITPQTEKLCYEFTGTYEGQKYIVYIDAKTGDEADVLIIIDSTNGQMVI